MGMQIVSAGVGKSLQLQFQPAWSVKGTSFDGLVITDLEGVTRLVPHDCVTSIRQISREDDPNLAGKAGFAALGALALGPLGLLAAVGASGSSEQHWLIETDRFPPFVVKVRDASGSKPWRAFKAYCQANQKMGF